jgi:hypothetical protein
MATPSAPPDPTVPADPPETPDQSAADAAAAQAAADAAALTSQIRDLATTISQQSILAFDPATVIKGQVTAIDTTDVPPTLSVQVNGDTTTTITGVVYLDSYAPVVGDTCLIVKQDANLFALGQLAAQFSASGWTLAPLGAGFTHGGNGNGSVRYRRVWDNGSWRMDWKGGAASDGSSTAIIASGGIPAGYVPASLVSLNAARDAQGAVFSVKIDFSTDGSVNLRSPTPVLSPVTVSGPSTDSTNTVDPVDNTTTSGGGTTNVVGVDENTSPDSTTSTDTGGFAGIDESTGAQTAGTAHTHYVYGGHTHSMSAHFHYVYGGHSHSTPDHSHGVVGSHAHTLSAHTHTVGVATPAPAWVSFNGISYYLDNT